MRKLLSLILFFILVLLVEICSAQKAEVTAGISGNLFNYGGTAASSGSSYYSSLVFSKKLTAGYGANMQVKFIAEKGFMLGLQGGYEVLNSKSNINSLIVIDYFTVLNPPNNYPYGLGVSPGNYGYANNTTKLINVNPFLGYRFSMKKYTIDLTLGADVGLVVEDKNHTVYSYSSGSGYTTYYDRSKSTGVNYSKTDFRIKTGVAINYNHHGIDLSYAHGVNNLVMVQNGYPTYYSPGSAFSQVLRLGLNYRLF